MGHFFKFASTLAGSFALAVCASAQTGLYDSAHTGDLEQGKSRFQFQLNPYSGNESSPYYSLSYTYNWSRQFAFQLRGSAAKRSTFNGVRTGGSDIEFRVIGGTENYFFAVGAALPDTPAQDTLTGTFQAGLQAKTDETSTIMLGLTGLTSDEVTLIGFGGGFESQLGKGLTADGSVTILVRGDNTVNLGSGLTERESVYSLGLGYRVDEQLSFRLGYGNSIGKTTGFSLTPRLGAGGGLYFGAEVRF